MFETFDNLKRFSLRIKTLSPVFILSGATENYFIHGSSAYQEEIEIKTDNLKTDELKELALNLLENLDSGKSLLGKNLAKYIKVKRKRELECICCKESEQEEPQEKQVKLAIRLYENGSSRIAIPATTIKGMLRRLYLNELLKRIENHEAFLEDLKTKYALMLKKEKRFKPYACTKWESLKDVYQSKPGIPDHLMKKLASPIELLLLTSDAENYENDVGKHKRDFQPKYIVDPHSDVFRFIKVKPVSNTIPENQAKIYHLCRVYKNTGHQVRGINIFAEGIPENHTFEFEIILGMNICDQCFSIQAHADNIKRRYGIEYSPLQFFKDFADGKINHTARIGFGAGFDSKVLDREALKSILSGVNDESLSKSNEDPVKNAEHLLFCLKELTSLEPKTEYRLCCEGSKGNNFGKVNLILENKNHAGAG